MNVIEQLHRTVPQTMTKENLAKWITENQKQVISHIDKTPLSPEEVSDYEHKSSMASRAIDRLDEVKADFMHFYKKGTPYDGTNFVPQDLQIPGTKGVDALKKNREFADEILEKGYTETTTEVYVIPNPDDSQMVGVTIEGYECPDYTRPMTEDEDALYGKLFKKENGELRQLDNTEVDVSRNGTAHIKTKPRGKARQLDI